MNKDLEETLAELGPGYRSVVDRLAAAFPDRTGASPTIASRFEPPRRRAWRGAFAALASGAGLLAAASVAVAMFFSTPSHAQGPSGAYRGDYLLAYSGDVESLLRTQKADGSWGNDFLTRQNAAAIRRAKGADVAYRRAVRYLRTKGLSPLSDSELIDRGAFAAQCASRG